MRKLGVVMVFGLVFATSSHAETMDIEQILQRVMDHYPSLKSAAMQVEKARQDSVRVQSRLGWQFGAKGGISRDTSFFGSPVDSLDVNGGMSRQLASGASLDVQAGIRHEEAQTAVVPTLPNPLTTTRIDLSYRLPLRRGVGNPAYAESLASAQSGLVLAQAEERMLYDQLATQIIDLHLAARTTLERIDSTKQSLQRTMRLQKYIQSKSGLGIAEEKDLLQVAAQLNTQKAQLKALEMAWAQQRISLNRLMGRPWDARLTVLLRDSNYLPEQPFDALLGQVVGHNPDLMAVEGRLQLANSTIRQRRDARKDQLDLIISIGNRTRTGDAVGGDISDSDIAGGLNMEFTRSLDRRGQDAELYQAQLERGIAIQDKRRILEDLHYDLASLLAELKTGRAALQAYRKSVKSEKNKLDEATERYRRGRADTDQIIQFESDLSNAEFALALQMIELQRRFYRLQLLRGRLWSNIKLPSFEISEEALAKGDQS